ncbi:hypothetical protein GZ77_24040 [Endozoicomonas montiporae]|uniref:Uncharacterized protein n=1 Tax=Endozoicomonas montiporae TaxID=1027273 RepID=A0A081MZH4_9GAMM|nr:hypothetical protein GZ77_24040 [Endozoicomonas montiporae]
MVFVIHYQMACAAFRHATARQSSRNQFVRDRSACQFYVQKIHCFNRFRDTSAALRQFLKNSKAALK